MPRLFPLAHLVLGALLPLASFAGENVSRPGVLHLSLDDAIRMALAKNFSIEVTRYEPQIARERVTSELGAFDPVFDLEIRPGRTRQRNAFFDGRSVQTGSRNFRDTFSTGLGGLTPWGTLYDFGFGIERTTGSENDFDERYASSLDFTLTQPLLRGAGADANLRGVRIARNNVIVSEWELRQRVIEVTTDTVFFFNELALAHENLEVANRSLGLARQLLDDNTKRAEIGVMSPLNITTARAEAAARVEGVIVAQRLVKDNENFLKQRVTNDLEAMLSVQIEIDPPPSPAFRADVRAGLRDALALRPDYRQAILDLENRQITLAFEKNAVLPQLDLTASLGLLGLYNELGGSVGRIASRDQTEWAAGAIFRVPIPNRAGRGAVNAARLTAAQGLVDLQRLEQQIIVEVDNASGQIVAARERIVSTSEASKLAKESLDAGEERLRAGTGTTFEVLELQKRLSEAEVAQLRARADYNEAVNTYYRLTGVTTRVYRITVGK